MYKKWVNQLSQVYRDLSSFVDLHEGGGASAPNIDVIHVKHVHFGMGKALATLSIIMTANVHR